MNAPDWLASGKNLRQERQHAQLRSIEAKRATRTASCVAPARECGLEFCLSDLSFCAEFPTRYLVHSLSVPAAERAQAAHEPMLGQTALARAFSFGSS